LFWIRFPLTADAESVFTRAGSNPLATRASHSQPTSEVPMFVDEPAAWFWSAV